jgi:hypothetical protein
MPFFYPKKSVLRILSATTAAPNKPPLTTGALIALRLEMAWTAQIGPVSDIYPVGLPPNFFTALSENIAM